MYLAGKYNTYKVIKECENEEKTQKWFLLRCIDVFGVDDLGDHTPCGTLGQEMWVANYFVRHMPVLDIKE